MVAVAQSVRALDCRSRGCGFDSRQPPLTDCEIADFGLRIGWPFESAIRNRQSAIDCRSVAQLVEHRSPKPGVAGSIPAGPAWAATEGVAALRAPGRINALPSLRSGNRERLLPGLFRKCQSPQGMASP